MSPLIEPDLHNGGLSPGRATVYVSGLILRSQLARVLVDIHNGPAPPEIAERATAKGLSAIDAPVSGGDVGARNATLSIMVGGDRKAVQAVMPLFELLGKKIVHQGGPGSGQHAKLCNQIVIAGTMVGVCESMVYGYKAGLNLNRMLESIRGGAAACWTLDNLAPRILQRNFDPGFFVEHFIKDMGLALEESKRMGLVRQSHVGAPALQTSNDRAGRSGIHARCSRSKHSHKSR